METGKFYPMDERAKGKSKLFSFVNLRNPKKADSSKKTFVRNSNYADSHYLKDVDNPDKKGSKEKLRNDSQNFTPYDSESQISKINPQLFEFSNWLGQNKNTLTKESVNSQASGISNYTDAQLTDIWDNLFYQIITQRDYYLREALFKVIIANNFIQYFQKADSNTSNSDFRQVASSRVIVPKSIISNVPKSREQKTPENNQAEYERNFVSKESLMVKRLEYERAENDMLTLNSLYIDALSKVDTSAFENSSSSGSGDESVITSSLDIDELREQVGNPLSKAFAEQNVSQSTLDIIEDLNLEKTRNPLEALELIKKELLEINYQLIDNDSKDRKIVVSGGSVIEMPKRATESKAVSSGFTAGCMPTIVDDVGVNVDETNNRILSTTKGDGNSGGASQNQISEFGSVSFKVDKLPDAGASYYVGLSPSNSDESSSSIKYAIRITTYFLMQNGRYLTKAIPFKNGSAFEDPFTCELGDEFRISRYEGSNSAQISWQRYRATNNSLATMGSEDDESGGSSLDSLVLDFAFDAAKESFSNVLIVPCEDDGDQTGGDDDTDKECSGVKNLGISDYLRVEQEVCCYTAGEVSHVENILKGEYKERSTRRLRRQETTTTFESETTNEKIRDTSTTDRHELEQESSQVIQEDSAFDLGVTLSARYGPTQITVDSGFATSSSSTEANSQAVSYAKEVSSRALDRVITRIREERINKVIEEFEENNLHGLDNSQNSDGHVTGIYRWIDKIYKNQIVNYGKRLTFEFMIPEPAKFHLWALANEEVGISLEKPFDPRTNPFFSSHRLVNGANAASYASRFDVKIEPEPALNIEVMEGYAEGPNNQPFQKTYNTLQIPDGYILDSISVTGRHSFSHSNQNSPHKFIIIAIADEQLTSTSGFKNISGYKQKTVPVSVLSDRIVSFIFNVTAQLKRRPELYEQWQLDTYNKIIDAYLEKKAAYDNALAEAKSQASFGIQIQGNNPLYNRTIEKQELQKGCMNWLEANYGNDGYDIDNSCSSDGRPVMITNEDQACYAKKVKFFEQAFDWNIMSYLFYPYFYGKKCSWKEIYKLDDNDPIFRAFLQAGMSRVVVPVKPNYEAAVMYYIETGEVWNGGEAPVPDDPLYVSIADDLAEQDPTPVGEPWETRVPTSLNILQKDSSAIDESGLPCNCNDYTKEANEGSTLSGNRDGGISKFEVS